MSGSVGNTLPCGNELGGARFQPALPLAPSLTPTRASVFPARQWVSRGPCTGVQGGLAAGGAGAETLGNTDPRLTVPPNQGCLEPEKTRGPLCSLEMVGAGVGGAGAGLSKAGAVQLMRFLPTDRAGARGLPGPAGPKGDPGSRGPMGMRGPPGECTQRCPFQQRPLAGGPGLGPASRPCCSRGGLGPFCPPISVCKRTYTRSRGAPRLTPGSPAAYFCIHSAHLPALLL